jgi:hypothetical protein
VQALREVLILGRKGLPGILAYDALRYPPTAADKAGLFCPVA